MNETDIAQICKALGDPNRLKIIEVLSGGEMCACKLLERFQITQPTLSHHMKILCKCGLVEVRREGKWCHYSLQCESFSSFQQFIGGLTCCKTEEGGGRR